MGMSRRTLTGLVVAATLALTTAKAQITTGDVGFGAPGDESAVQANPGKIGLLLAATGFAMVTQSAPRQFVVEGSCRDGQAHGGYELRSANGQVRAVGAFNRGRRSGSFLFWNEEGRRIAQLPYEEDVLSGTVALWYEAGGRDSDPLPKLEAAYVNGRLSGTKRSWHPNGRLRTELRYRDGSLATARAFTAAGTALPESGARSLAGSDLVADATLLAALETILRANLPHCDPASDRLERGQDTPLPRVAPGFRFDAPSQLG